MKDLESRLQEEIAAFLKSKSRTSLTTCINTTQDRKVSSFVARRGRKTFIVEVIKKG